MNPILIKKEEQKMIKKINSVEELKENCSDEIGEFYVLLNYGLRSSKTIYFNTKTKRFSVLNEIDGTRQSFTEKSIFNEERTNIGKAIKQGAFYKY